MIRNSGKLLHKCIKTVTTVWNRSSSNNLSPMPQTSVVEVNKNVKIFQQTASSTNPRPILLLFGWLFAKPKHLKKFTDMYLRQGFDVISVQIFLRQLLGPKRVQSVMRGVLDICLEDKRRFQPIVVHCLSVGGYMYGEVLTNCVKYPDKYDSVSRRLRGQIFDSVVDYYGIPGGISRAITANKATGKKIETSLEWYMTKFPSVTGEYMKSSETVQDNKLRLPSIFIYSVSDPVCNPEHYEQIVTMWRLKGLYATSRFWNDAPHVSTFMKHREEYTQTIVDFIRRTGVHTRDIKLTEDTQDDVLDTIAREKVLST